MTNNKDNQQETAAQQKLYNEVLAAIVASERSMSDVFMAHFKANKPLTPADLYGMGIGRRALALSSGFRVMVEQCNSLCALPIVRMQLDTALRLYAGFFVTDHQEFCREVMKGRQINQLKSDEGKPMQDAYLVKRVAERNPWMEAVYKSSSGYIHFSHRHISEALRKGEGNNARMVIGPADFDREPRHFLEPMMCVHHLNQIIEFALKDWFLRMCDPCGVTISAHEAWGEGQN